MKTRGPLPSPKSPLILMYSSRKKQYINTRTQFSFLLTKRNDIVSSFVVHFFWLNITCRFFYICILKTYLVHLNRFKNVVKESYVQSVLKILKWGRGRSAGQLTHLDPEDQSMPGDPSQAAMSIPRRPWKCSHISPTNGAPADFSPSCIQACFYPDCLSTYKGLGITAGEIIPAFVALKKLCLEAICSFAEHQGGPCIHLQSWFNARAKGAAKRVVVPSPRCCPDAERPSSLLLLDTLSCRSVADC